MNSFELLFFPINFNDPKKMNEEECFRKQLFKVMFGLFNVF